MMRLRGSRAGAAAVLALAGLLVAGASDHEAATATRPPNIVFVLTDDLSTDLVRFMPQVVALGREGTRFSNYTVTDSLCCPSRSSIFTGRYPHNTHVFTNTGDDGGFALFHSRDEESSTFATDLQQAGYRTALLGKYLNGYLPDDPLGGTQPYVPPGWDEWDVTGKGYGEFDYTLNHNHLLEPHAHKASDYLVDVLSADATSFIADSAAAGQPFLLEVATFVPHEPYSPAPADRESFPGLRAPRGPSWDTVPTDAPPWLTLGHRRPLTAAQKATIDADYRKRAQAVQSVDRLIAAVRQALAAAHVDTNTVIVFSSDNGYHMGQHRLMPGKRTAFETDIRVPLVVAGPGVAHRIVAQPAENVDLRSTFDALTGVSAPAEVDGRDLAPLLRGQRVAAWRHGALVEHHANEDVSDPDFQLAVSGHPPTYAALRTPAYTYVEDVDGNDEFYDLAADPHELRNAYAALTDSQRAALHAALAQFTSCAGAACRAADAALPSGA